MESVDVRVETGDVTVVDKEVKDGFKRHTVYTVEVKIDRRLIIIGRYSQFLSLFEKVKRKFPNLSVKLPGKKLFGNFEPEVIRSRRHAVRDFVLKLVTTPELLQYDAVRLFLTLDVQSDENDDEAYCSGQISSSRISTRRNSTDGDHLMHLMESTISVEQAQLKPSDFEYLSVIGKGNFGKVFVARHKEEEKLLAIKVLNKELIVKSNEVEHIMCERRVLLLNTPHPFLVGLHCAFQTKDKLYLVMDYINGGEIFFHLQKEKRFSESRARFYAAEISSALGYLHSNDVIYRDLKPENILLDSEGHVMLTDFGLCKEGAGTTFCGTAEYLSPELLQHQPYDRMVDWWCLGAVLYEMIFGLPPFYSRDRNEMFDRIQNKPLEFKSDVVSPHARTLLTELLEKDRTKRLGSKNDFDDIKNHSYFVSIDWTLLSHRKIPPPFVPELSEQMDLRNFDADFTNEPVPDSVVRATNNSLASSTPISRAAATSDRLTQHFNGFTYTRPTEEIYCF